MPEDFLQRVILGLKNLHSNKRSNIIYSLTKGIATLGTDESDTLFPPRRMPTGLVEYIHSQLLHHQFNSEGILYLHMIVLYYHMIVLTM